MKNLGLLFTKLYFKPRKGYTYHLKEIDKKRENEGKESEKNENEYKLQFKKVNQPTSNTDELTTSIFEEKSKELTSITFKKCSLPPIGSTRQLFLITVYPGLLVGSGYIHDIKNDGAFKLGFYFDYTTGLPVIPGSSVKGVLRSAFIRSKDYTADLLKEITGKNYSNDEIAWLENDIFEGTHNGNPKPICQRDIFFDAFPVATANENGRFLANDYITPHKDPLKNPVPLQFLKVLPGVTFRFNFKLHDTTDVDGKVLLSADHKLELFKRVLLDLGVGAKTNVGYGQFVADEKMEKEIKNKKKQEGLEKKRQEEAEEKKRKIQEEGIAYLIGNIMNWGDLKDVIEEYVNTRKIEGKLPEKDQKVIIERAKKIINKKQKKYRAKTAEKLKTFLSPLINEDLLETLVG